ncbi:MAG: hypothetical protein VKK04_25880, partial [Synechococcales bacterium]|nr:hypothetical protein [Synechococcales bacterium]
MTEMHPPDPCRTMMRVGLGVSLLIVSLLAASCDFQSATLQGTEGQASGDSEPVAEAISLPEHEGDDDAIAPEVSPNPDQSLAAPVIPDGLSIDPLGPTVGDTYARQPVQLVDEATPATDFYAFRAALQQAIADRDSEFLEAIAAPDIQLSFGTRTISDLNLNDPAALVWEKLE